MHTIIAAFPLVREEEGVLLCLRGVLPSFLWIYPLLHPQEQDPSTFPSSMESSTSSFLPSFLVLLNLSAAFNSSDQTLILNILSNFCFSDFTLYWFSLYLPGSSSSVSLKKSPFLPGKSQPLLPYADDSWILISNLDFPELRHTEDSPVSQIYTVSKGTFSCMGPSLLSNQLFLCVPWLSDWQHLPPSFSRQKLELHFTPFSQPHIFT